MKKIGLLVAVLCVILLISCQKEPDSIDNPPVPPPPPVVDTLPAYVVTGVWWYYYNATGALEDSEHVTYTYDTTALTTTIFDENWYPFGFFSNKHVFYYDKAGNWTKDAELDVASNAVRRSNIFIRNASGDPIRFDYSIEGDPKSYSALFQYKSLANSNKEITVVDSMNTFNSAWWTGYYKVELDNAGKMVRRIAMAWDKNNNYTNQHYFYDANGQIIKVVDSSRYNSTTTWSVITTSYIQDPLANYVLDTFSRNLKGKNFWWYDCDRNYIENSFYEYTKYIGNPLISQQITTTVYENGILINSTARTVTFTNTYDQDKNLTSLISYENGKKRMMYKFFYKKTK